MKSFFRRSTFMRSVFLSSRYTAPKFLSSIRGVYFELQTRSVEFKGGFPRYFCTSGVVAASLFRRSFSLPVTLSSILSSLFLSLSVFFFSVSASVCESCDATMLPISSSRDHLLPRLSSGPVRSGPVKVSNEIPTFVNFSFRCSIH